MRAPSQSVQYYQYIAEQLEVIDTEVIVETPVSLTVNGDVWLTFMCTPVDLEAMAIGFLYNEGLIKSIEDIADVRLCATGDNIDIWTRTNIEKPNQWRRTSGCTGGITSVTEDSSNRLITNGGVLTGQVVGELINQLFESQTLYRAAGGVHTSALSDGKRLCIVTEDIGRHNTLDKIAGRCLMEKLELQRRIIITTGRISSEMLQKAARLSASFVISRTSPSSMSIDLAEQYGITLIGYARRNRFNIYTHPERIALPEAISVFKNT